MDSKRDSKEMLNCQVCHDEPAVAIVIDEGVEGDGTMVYVGINCLNKGDLPFLQYNRMGASIILSNGIVLPLGVNNMAINENTKNIFLSCTLFSYIDENYENYLFDIFNKGESFKIKVKEKMPDGKIIWAHGIGRIYSYRPIIENEDIMGEEVEIAMDAKALSMGRTVK